VNKKKKYVSSPHVSSIFKKISPKTFGPHCVYKRHIKNISIKYKYTRGNRDY